MFVFFMMIVQGLRTVLKIMTSCGERSLNDFLLENKRAVKVILSLHTLKLH